MSYQRGGKSLQRYIIKNEMFRVFFILLFSRLLQSGSEPGLSLSLRVGSCLSLACQDVGEPDERVVVV